MNLGNVKNIFFVLILAVIFAGCSSTSDEEYFQSASKLIHDEKYAEALMEYDKLIQEYPESKFTPRAIIEVGKLYHGQVIKNLSPEESFAKAIAYYRKLANNYPDDPSTPNALFMIGFIQANEIKQLDSARASYNAFIEKYPDNELTFSAKVELENLGVPPEEILKNHVTKE